MTSLENKLRKIEDFLKKYPNASVRIKLNGSDNYRHFPSNAVRNEIFCETRDEHFVFEDFDNAENETDAKYLRNEMRNAR